MIRISDRWRWIWLLVALAAVAAYPALRWNSGAVAYDAAHVHIYRGLIFSDALRDGVLYPRWVQFFHHGLGSPVFTFYSPLPYYALDLLDRLGLAHPLGWRVLMAGGLLAACLGAYLLVKEITGQRWPAMVAGVAYLYAPYVLRNALERGSNEAFCTFLYPWVLWGIVRLARRPTRIRFVVAALLWAAAIGTHVLGPLMLAPAAALLAAALAWRQRTAVPLLALLAGGLLTAVIWAPIIQEKGNVHAERGFDTPAYQPWANPLPLDRLLALPAVYDTARENNDTGDRIGLIQTALLALGLPAAVYAWLRGHRSQALYLGAASLLGLGLLWSFTGAADAAWKLAAPILDYLQFRTRLMGLQALAAATVAGLLLALVPRRWQAAPAALLVAALVLAAIPSLYIDLRHEYAPIGDQVTRADVRAAEFNLEDSALTAFGETVPRWHDPSHDMELAKALGPQFDPEVTPLVNPPTGLRIDAARVRSDTWDLALTSPRAVEVTLYLLYYPRWQAQIDGAPATLRPQPKTGYTQISVPAGSHRVALRYGTTAAETAGWALTGLTCAALLTLALWPARRARGRPRIRHGCTDDLPTAASSIHPHLAVARWGRCLWPDLGSARALPPFSDAPGTSGSLEPAPAPPAWLLLGLTGLLAFKVFYVDGSTSWFRCVSTATHVCGAGNTVSAALQGGLRLRGYDALPETISRGGELRVHLFWQGDYRMTQGQYSFLHLRSAEEEPALNPKTGDPVWLSVRHEGPGGFFNTAYEPGKIYEDEYRVELPVDLPPGRYQVAVGWLDVGSGDLMPPQADTVHAPLEVVDQSIVLKTIEVK